VPNGLPPSKGRQRRPRHDPANPGDGTRAPSWLAPPAIDRLSSRREGCSKWGYEGCTVLGTGPVARSVHKASGGSMQLAHTALRKEGSVVTSTDEASGAAAFALSVATLEVLNDKGLISREEGRLILERAAQNVEGNPPHGWHAAQALRFAKEGPRF